MTREIMVGKAEKMARRIKARRERNLKAAAKIDRLVLMDGSGSMSAVDAADMGGTPCSRFDALQEVWDKVVPLGKGRLGAFVFSDGVQAVRGSAKGIIVQLPCPGGSTAMRAALRACLKFAHPGLRVLLVSDGESTDGDPVGDAMLLGCPVDAVFVGPKDGDGKATLEQIARATGGEFRDYAGRFDAARFLEHMVNVLKLKEG